MTDNPKSLVELIARIDERVQTISKKQDIVYAKLDNNLEQLNNLAARVAVMEDRVGNHLVSQIKQLSDAVDKVTTQSQITDLKINSLDISARTQDSRWKTIGSFVIQLTWAILASYLLYKIGLPAI